MNSYSWYLKTERETNQDPQLFLGKSQPKHFDDFFFVNCNIIFFTKGHVYKISYKLYSIFSFRDF